MFAKDKLLKDIEKKKETWDERSCFKMKGIGNISRADLDTIELYARTGGVGLRKPLCEVGEVLAKYGYEHPIY